MANFKTSYEKTAKFEGGYVNHKNDRGGETYKGIARNMWPQWAGWGIVDKYKSTKADAHVMVQLCENNVELQQMVHRFYRVNFWDKIMGDQIMNQLVADNIYDFAVNSGVSRAVKYAQRIVKTTEDGIMGNQTIKAINQNIEGFVTKYKAERLAFFNRIVQNDSTQSVFIKGWTNRVHNA